MKVKSRKLLTVFAVLLIVVSCFAVPSFAAGDLPGIPQGDYEIFSDGFDYYVRTSFFRPADNIRYLSQFFDASDLSDVELTAKINELCDSFVLVINDQEYRNVLSFSNNKFIIQHEEFFCYNLGVDDMYFNYQFASGQFSFSMYGYYDIELPQTGALASLTGIFSLVVAWLASGFGALFSVFYFDSKLTFLGVFALAALAVSVFLLLVYFIGGFL